MNSFSEPIQTIASDLAPGDQTALSFSWDALHRVQVSSPEDPIFDLVYSRLWKEFGPQGEIESRQVLIDRLRWDPAKIQSNSSLLYEMMAVLKDQEFVAARDHTAIVCTQSSPEITPEVIVHLSHSLIEPLYRGQGMAGWLRAWPLQTARRALSAAGLPLQSPVTLVAEMEPMLPNSIPHQARLRSYEKAGFLMVDPAQFDYLQPDFRDPKVIDSTGGGPQPLHLRLVIRRVNHEAENLMEGSKLTRIISALYHMYQTTFRPQDMAVVWKHLRSNPLENVTIRLVQPLSESTCGSIKGVFND